MTTKEQIYAEVEHMTREQLESVYAFVLQLRNLPPTPRTSIYDALADIRFDGPADLSTNFEKYMGGIVDDEESDIR